MHLSTQDTGFVRTCPHLSGNVCSVQSLKLFKMRGCDIRSPYVNEFLHLIVYIFRFLVRSMMHVGLSERRAWVYQLNESNTNGKINKKATPFCCWYDSHSTNGKLPSLAVLPMRDNATRTWRKVLVYMLAKSCMCSWICWAEASI